MGERWIALSELLFHGRSDLNSTFLPGELSAMSAPSTDQKLRDVVVAAVKYYSDAFVERLCVDVSGSIINLDADEELDEKERKLHFLEDRCDTIRTAIRMISTNSKVVALKKEAAQDEVEDTERLLCVHNKITGGSVRS